MYSKYFKRIIDFTLSLIAIIVLSPVFLVTAILVRIKLGSPVIFKQKRPGLNKRIFTIYKFRTMTDEKDENNILLSDETRLTKFGELLRSLSLDELPQLLNIFKGNMSIVGPRPLLIEDMKRYSKEHYRRHDVRPGLSGLAQINGRNMLSWEDKFNYDVEYVNKISFKLDFNIFLKTIIKVVKRQDVFLENDNILLDLTEEENKNLEI